MVRGIRLVEGAAVGRGGSSHSSSSKSSISCCCRPRMDRRIVATGPGTVVGNLLEVARTHTARHQLIDRHVSEGDEAESTLALRVLVERVLPNDEMFDDAEGFEK